MTATNTLRRYPRLAIPRPTSFKETCRSSQDVPVPSFCTACSSSLDDDMPVSFWSIVNLQRTHKTCIADEISRFHVFVFVSLHHYVIRRLSLVPYTQRKRYLTCAQTTKQCVAPLESPRRIIPVCQVPKNAIIPIQIQHPTPDPPRPTTPLHYLTYVRLVRT